MTIAVGDLIRVTAVGEAFGQRIMLTHSYGVQQIVGPQPEADVCNELLNELRAGGGGDLYETLYLGLLPTDYQLIKWVVQKTNPVRYVQFSVNRGSVGTHVGPCEEPNLAAVISFRTLLAGRDQVSNKHIGPIPGGATVRNEGEIVIAYKNLLDTFAVALSDSIALAATNVTLAPCIAHRAALGTYTTIQSHVVQEQIRVMRRRTVRFGE